MGLSQGTWEDGLGLNVKMTVAKNDRVHFLRGT